MSQTKDTLVDTKKESELYDWTVGTHYGIKVEEVKQIYDKTASEYEQFYTKTGWVAYIHSAKLFEKVLSKLGFEKDCKILDVGAGTGLVGNEMYKLGYANLTGIDLSEEMLAEASKKGVYKHLVQVDMYNFDISIYSQKFDAVISIGTFTVGQLKPEIIPKLARFVRPGGVVCISFRDITWENPETGFTKQVEEMEKTGVWILVEKGYFSYHSELGENCYCFVFKVE